MTIDLICLLILALWTVPLNHGPAIARVQAGGVKWALSNRETPVEVPLWVGRADRAQRNHHDNLVMFAVVILTTAVTGQADDITAISSIVIVVMRILHGVFYVLGIPTLRSLTFFAAFFALWVIVWRLVI